MHCHGEKVIAELDGNLEGLDGTMYPLDPATEKCSLYPMVGNSKEWSTASPMTNVAPNLFLFIGRGHVPEAPCAISRPFSLDAQI